MHDNPGSAGHLLLLRLAAIAGTDERTLRTPSAIAVALAAGLLVVLGTLMLGRLAGLVAGIALAANAAVVEHRGRRGPTRSVCSESSSRQFSWSSRSNAAVAGDGSRTGVTAALLPLTHPLAASVLAAHGAALIANRGRRDVRHAGIALLAGTIVAALLLAWMAADRFDAPDGAGTLDLARLGRGLLHAVGWNPILCAAAVVGPIILLGAFGPTVTRWQGVLVAGLIGAPIVATLLAAIVLPIFPGALVLCAPGIALAVGAVAPLLSPTRGLVWAG